MRTTKKTKPKTITKPETNSLKSNSNSASSSQTPIEIALKIDENGMTTLRNLYEFLGLNLSHYSSWCKRNILNNPFATEGIDYLPFRLKSENPKIGGRPTYDYKLTSDFAKHISMTVKNERGQEARKYFIACEQGLRVAAQKLQSISDNNTNKKLIELLTSMDNRLSKLEEQSNKKKLPEKKYSRWKTNTFKKLNTLLSYVNTHREEKLQLSEIIHLVIREMENTYGIEVNDYTDAYKSEFDLDVIPYVIDVINHYKDIRDIFTSTLDSILQKLHITESIILSEERNIFDELAAKMLSKKEK